MRNQSEQISARDRSNSAHHATANVASNRAAVLMEATLLDMKEVLALTRWSRSTLYNRMRDNQFPHPRCTGPRTRGWSASEVFSFLNSCKVA